MSETLPPHSKTHSDTYWKIIKKRVYINLTNMAQNSFKAKVSKNSKKQNINSVLSTNKILTNHKMDKN